MDWENINIKPVWAKSKEEIWVEKFEPLIEQSRSISIARRIPLWGYAAGLLIPLLLFFQLFTVTESAKRGEQKVVQLPDRSTVTLNAASKLSYNPFIWLISKKGTISRSGVFSGISPSWLFTRKVRFEGEAFFDVKPGSLFSVQTGDNRVNVLGTSFNVHARAGAYRVTCLSGQVEVQTEQGSAVLNPNMQATVHDRELNITGNVTPSVATGWMQGMFVFAGAPLGEVIAEIERRYNIYVTPDYDANLLYTGIFSKTENSEEVLEAVGKAFGITFNNK